MSEGFIVRRGGAGGKVFAFIVVTYPVGSTCTCSDGTKVLRAKGTTGSFVFNIPYAATWTVSCTDGTDTATEDIVITTQGQSVSLELSYRVPSAYQAVEYLEVTGTQYINDAIPNETAFKVEIEANFLNNYFGAIFGRHDGGTASAFLMLYVEHDDGNSSCRAFFGSDSYTSVNAGSVGLKSIESSFGIIGVPNVLKVNGTSATPPANVITGYTHGATIFAMRYSSTFYNYKATGIQLKSFKWYDKNGVLARDFAPCYRKSDNVAGLWDVVNKRFYTNDGTGTFVVGGNI